MRRLVMWYFLQNKRLFKKYSFIIILCMVPVLVGAIRMVAQEDSGVLRIVLCACDSQDEFSKGIIEDLKERDSLLHYIECDTEEQARELLSNYEADAAWIFPENLQENLQDVAHNKMIEPVVKVIEREDTVMLIMSREILCKSLYPFYTYASYKDFVINDIGLTEVSEEELQNEYNRTMVQGNLFQMEYLDGQVEEESNYLLAPIRGILALWLVLCGFAASMYYIQDEKDGVFSCIPIKKRLPMSFVMQAVLLTDAIVVLLVACKIVGVFTAFHIEVINGLLFVGCTMVFCNLVRILCRTMERLGSCIPIMLVAMLVLSPVFLDVKKFRVIQYLLPSYYYLKSIHSVFYTYGMVVYIAVVGVLCVVIYRRKSN